jgi:hypothetical protein
MIGTYNTMKTAAQAPWSARDESSECDCVRGLLSTLSVHTLMLKKAVKSAFLGQTIEQTAPVQSAVQSAAFP